MSKHRKNLNDVIHGDRSAVRGYKSSLMDDVDKILAEGKPKIATHYDAPWYDDPSKGNTKGLSTITGGKSTTYYSGSTERCYHKHPPLKLPNGQVIYGGSCSSPLVTDADVYIGFDLGMKPGKKSYPWEPGHAFLFPIPDMGVPSSSEDFKKLVAWTQQQLDKGRKVHCGCIGGHGRTGTFLAALVAAQGEPDAIAYVRKGYCKKAVESTAQVDFLVKHFGAKKAEGFKASGGSYYSGNTKREKAPAGTEEITFIKGRGSIWAK